MNHIFISYVHEDELIARKVVDLLKLLGFDVWIDKDSLYAGTLWKQEIKNAIKSGTYFLCFFSISREKKPVSMAHDELLLAVDQLRQRPYNQKWFIPVKVDNCDIPDLPIFGDESLRSFHWVELYSDFYKGFRSILVSLDATELQFRQIASLMEEPRQTGVAQPSISFLQYISSSSPTFNLLNMHIRELHSYCNKTYEDEDFVSDDIYVRVQLRDVKHLLDTYTKGVRSAMEYFSFHFNKQQHEISSKILDHLVKIELLWRYVEEDGLFSGDMDEESLAEIIERIASVNSNIGSISNV